MISPLPSLLELDSESNHSLREALQGENVLVPSDISTHLDSDRSHRTVSQNFRNQSWSMPPDVLSREMEENVQNVRALESDHPVNHPNEQKLFPDDSTPDRQLSNQARERTVERADEPPTQCPRLENPASSIRWSRVDVPRHWVPATTMEDEGKSTITFGRRMGNLPVCAKKWDELFSNTCENITAQVSFSQSEFTGLTATRMTRGDELPRHMIPDSEWPRFLQATVTEWAAFLDTSAVTIISPAAA